MRGQTEGEDYEVVSFVANADKVVSEVFQNGSETAEVGKEVPSEDRSDLGLLRANKIEKLRLLIVEIRKIASNEILELKTRMSEYEEGKYDAQLREEMEKARVGGNDELD